MQLIKIHFLFHICTFKYLQILCFYFHGCLPPVNNIFLPPLFIYTLSRPDTHATHNSSPVHVLDLSFKNGKVNGLGQMLPNSPHCD